MLFSKAIYDSTDDEDLRDDISATFEKLMADEFDEKIFSAQEKDSPLYRNYRFFRLKIDASNRTKEELCDAINQLNVVSILLKEENPQEIFESLNSTGLDLTKADLIRNFLLMPLDYDVQETFYKNYWLKIEELLRPSGNVENFLVRYLVAKLKSNDAYTMKASPKNLFILFKKYFDDKCPDVVTCLKDMLRYAKIFHHLLFNEDTRFDKLSPLDKKFYELIYLLKANNAPIILMYLLYRHEREPFSEETFIKFVDALISLTFRAKVCKRSGITQQFAGNVLSRLDKEDSLDSDKFWRVLVDSSKVTFPSDKDFQTALVTKNLYETINSDGCKYLLYSLERATRAKELPAYSSATVEHILPQKLSDSWKKYLQEQNDSQTHERWLHTLGNLTLTGYNPELGNGDFDKKKEIYSASNFYYTRALTDYSDWTSKQIQIRAKKLAAASIKIWMLPEELNSRFTKLGDTLNLDSDFGMLTGTKPSMLYIFDEEIKISAWKHLLCEVVKKLYSFDGDVFRYAISIRKNLFITETTDSKDLKLDENFYMKTKMDVERCLRTTKSLVENFDRIADPNFKEEISFTLRR